MVRNFGEKRKKKSHKNKSKGKGSRGEREMKEVTCREVAIYVPPERREAADEDKSGTQYARSSMTKNTYRSKRMERQRLKKDRKKEGWASCDDYPEDEEDDDGDYGGEYDEIIRTGTSRREARQARAFEQMSSLFTYMDLGSRRGRNEHTRSGRSGRNGRSEYDGDHGLEFVLEEISLFGLLAAAFKM